MAGPDDPPPTTVEYGRPGDRRRPRLQMGRVWVRIVIVPAVLVGLAYAVMPTTNLQRELKRRRQCARQLREIGVAIRAYCDDHGGACPDTLASLVRVEPDLPPATLCCPDDHDTPAGGADRGALADAVAAGGHCSYVYVGRGLKRSTATAATVVAYEPASPTTGHENGCNILWGDGHVDWHETADAARLLPSGTVVPWVQPNGTTRPGWLQIR